MLVDNIKSFHVSIYKFSIICDVSETFEPESFTFVRCLLAKPTRLPDLGWKDSLVVWSSRQVRYSWDNVVSPRLSGNTVVTNHSCNCYIGILKYESFRLGWVVVNPSCL